MKIAFVYDRVNKFGGAERVLLALHEIWPDAPLFTTVYNPKTAQWSKNFDVRYPKIAALPFFSTNHELSPFLMPVLFEQFNFDDFDVVLTITSADAKSIITKPDTIHVCYCLTPSRYLWSGYQEYVEEPGFGMINSLIRSAFRTLAPGSRVSDYISSRRPDHYIAISQTVASRIKTYYMKEAEVIYPPADDTFFTIDTSPKNGDYYLIVSRLVPYKKIDYVIDTFNTIRQPLKIIGSGIDEKRLKKRAAKNIECINHYLTDQELRWYYQGSRALIFPGDEDFGLTVIEAQLCGRPIIAWKHGGVKESVIPGVTGEFYEEPTPASLRSAMGTMQKKTYSQNIIRRHAVQFSKVRFQENIKTALMSLWKEQNKYTGVSR